MAIGILYLLVFLALIETKVNNYKARYRYVAEYNMYLYGMEFYKKIHQLFLAEIYIN